MSEDKTDVFRFPMKHARKLAVRPTAEDGARLVDAQSITGALVAGVAAVIAFCILWTLLSTLVNRVFPWLTLAMGMLVGLAMRRAGRGLDWRFPVLAAMLAAIGCLAGNIVVAAAFTAGELDTGTLTVLRAVTAMTWPVFFDEVMTPADAVYALFAAAIAAFYANRRLSSAEYIALRRWEERNDSKQTA